MLLLDATHVSASKERRTLPAARRRHSRLVSSPSHSKPAVSFGNRKKPTQESREMATRPQGAHPLVEQCQGIAVLHTARRHRGGPAAAPRTQNLGHATPAPRGHTHLSSTARASQCSMQPDGAEGDSSSSLSRRGLPHCSSLMAKLSTAGEPGRHARQQVGQEREIAVSVPPPPRGTYQAGGKGRQQAGHQAKRGIAAHRRRQVKREFLFRSEG